MHCDWTEVTGIEVSSCKVQTSIGRKKSSLLCSALFLNLFQKGEGINAPVFGYHARYPSFGSRLVKSKILCKIFSLLVTKRSRRRSEVTSYAHTPCPPYSHTSSPPIPFPTPSIHNSQALSALSGSILTACLYPACSSLPSSACDAPAASDTPKPRPPSPHPLLPSHAPFFSNHPSTWQVLFLLHTYQAHLITASSLP